MFFKYSASAILTSLLLASPVLADTSFHREIYGSLVTLEPMALTANEPTQAQFVLPKDSSLFKEQDYALGLRLDGPNNPIHLSVNGGKMLPPDIHGKTEQWWRVRSADLKPGANELRYFLEGTDDAIIADVVLFSLSGRPEDMHFPLLVAGESRAQPPSDPNQDLMDVEHMVLDLNITLDSRDISGIATVEAMSLADGFATCVLDLDSNSGDMAVTSVVDGTTNQPLVYTSTSSRVFITLSDAVNEGETFSVKVAYGGTPRSYSSDGYLRGTHSSVPVIYTNNQPYFGRTWIPCKDLPEDKFTLDLNVTVEDRSYDGHPIFVATNGSLIETTTDALEGTKTFHWKESYPIASYLISLAVTNFRASSSVYTALDGVTTMDVSHYVYPESYASQSSEAPNTAEVIRVFSEMFGEYPFLTEKYWTATWGLGYGMEHQTVTSMPDPSRTSDTLSTAFSRRNIHELAHMWFGDMITTRTYDHLWLNEGFATYCEALFYEQQAREQFGEAAAKTALHDYVNNWSTSDSVPIVSSNSDSFNLSITYRKGAWVLHMLRKVLGDEDFFAGMRAYVSDSQIKYDVALSSDVERVFNDVTGQDLGYFFDQWLNRSSRPNYQWSWVQSTAASPLSLQVVQTQSDDVYTMPIELELRYTDNSTELISVENNLRDQVFSIPTGGKSISSVTFDPDNWLLDTNQELTGVAPSAPTLLSVVGNGALGTVTVNWDPVVGLGVDGYRLYDLADPLSPTLLADESELEAGSSTFIIEGLTSGDSMLLALTTVASFEGDLSDAYWVKLGAANGQVLIVDGYDRWTNSEVSGEPHPLSSIHGSAMLPLSFGFDTTANEALGAGVDLQDYSAVTWVLGNESTVDETFSDAEQLLLRSYLESGRSLFVSGNEIAWDLDWRGSASDKDFFNNYLRAAYDSDDSNDYDLIGSGGVSIFETVGYGFGGGDAPFQPAYPDTLFPINSELSLTYDNNGDVAAIQSDGTVLAGENHGRVVLMGFAFETVNNSMQREDMMLRIMEYLLPEPTRIDSFFLF